MAKKQATRDLWISVSWNRDELVLLDRLTNPSGWVNRIHGEEIQVAMGCLLRAEQLHPLRLIQVHGRSTDPEGMKLGSLSQWERKDLGPKLTSSIMEAAESHSSHSEIASRLESLQYAILATEPARQPDVINDRIVRWLPELHAAKSYLVEVDNAQYYRPLASARLLYRKILEPSLFDALMEDGEVIQGAFGLMPNDTMGALSVLQPLLSANSPNHCGIVSPQMSGSIVFVFPTPMRFPIDAWPTNLHQLMKPSSIGAIRMEISEDSLRAPVPDFETISWWIQSWNRIFGQLADPSIHYWPKNRTFAPDLMIGRYYGLFRLLVCVQEILINTSVDEFVRLSALFEALDLFRGLGLNDFNDQKLANPGEIESELQMLEEFFESMPNAREVLLPQCRVAAKALVSMREGFVDESSTGSRDSDVASVIRQIRNLKHGSDNQLRFRESLKIVVRHKIDLPPDLADLAWFHLVRLLCFGKWS